MKYGIPANVTRVSIPGHKPYRFDIFPKNGIVFCWADEEEIEKGFIDPYVLRAEDKKKILALKIGYTLKVLLFPREYNTEVVS